MVLGRAGFPNGNGGPWTIFLYEGGCVVSKLAVIRGEVEDVNVGQASEKYPTPAVFLRIGGLSLMLGKGVTQPPVEGVEVEGHIKVRDRPGKAPLVFLQDWVPVSGD